MQILHNNYLMSQNARTMHCLSFDFLLSREFMSLGTSDAFSQQTLGILRYDFSVLSMHL